MERNRRENIREGTFDRNLNELVWTFEGEDSLVECFRYMEVLIRERQVVSAWRYQILVEGRQVPCMRLVIDLANVNLADKAGLMNY
jgi:hypothetical protein